MVEAHLKVYKTRNGTYPERILIFRDGVSEGQYAAVLHHEHSAVLDACERLEPGYRPRILLCICAKRHNTRFFGKLSDTDPSGNLPSGLVVDRTVTHPYVYDFFLQSHAARVGTARPTHYICLLDELGMTPDMLQQMVHNLCFSFARCTKSVSIVPVCYIAGRSSTAVLGRDGSKLMMDRSCLSKGPDYHSRADALYPGAVKLVRWERGQANSKCPAVHCRLDDAQARGRSWARYYASAEPAREESRSGRQRELC